MAERAPRFFVDARCGWIAVCDGNLIDNDPPRRNLNSSTIGVVWFEMGNKIDREPDISFKVVSKSQQKYAANLCDLLNGKSE